MQKSEIKPAPIELELPSGAKAQVLEKWLGGHLMKAQEIAGEKGHLMVYALAAQCTEIDGAKIVMEDFQAMDGRDVLKIIGHFSKDFQ
jgi:hypothetical protein